MIPRTRGLYGLARAPARYAQWQRLQVPHRSFASAIPDPSRRGEALPKNATPPEWFKKLRDEMIGRELPCVRENYHEETLHKLGSTLASYFPSSWRASSRTMPAGIGEHTFFCNPVLPDHELLPDGTDQIHSPGGTFVRRMWAGGSLTLATRHYWGKYTGWGKFKSIICSERIADVSLRGSGNDEKIFVSIERRFAMCRHPEYVTFTREELENITGGDKAYVVEVRNIVFLRARSPEELEDIKKSKFLPVKYILPPEDPDLSHSLIPTHSLLTRFSALTFNAHRIHLDREYARDVEGHRNLLVHGPLTLTLMLKFINTHLRSLPDGPYSVQRIEYRNLAPLYCDEELRICAKEKVKNRKSWTRDYDVWIEGPTGKMAVKAYVNATRPKTLGVATPEVQPTNSDDEQPGATALLLALEQQGK